MHVIVTLMKLDRFIRIALAAVILLVFIVATGALLFISESALNVWDRLKAGPPVMLYAYVGIMLLLAVTALWLIWRLVVRRKSRRQEKPAADRCRRPISRTACARLRRPVSTSVRHRPSSRNLRRARTLCTCASLVKSAQARVRCSRALVPEADVVVDVVGGSTDDVRHYRWRNDDGAEILLTDVPGIGGTEEGLTSVATDEAKRANIVLFVCDSDSDAIRDGVRQELCSKFDKPLIIVLNKADRYSADEQASLMQKLA